MKKNTIEGYDEVKELSCGGEKFLIIIILFSWECEAVKRDGGGGVMGLPACTSPMVGDAAIWHIMLSLENGLDLHLS